MSKQHRIRKRHKEPTPKTIFQSGSPSDFLIMDKSFWRGINNQFLTKVSKRLNILCPTILTAEIYNTDGNDSRLENNLEARHIDPWQLIVKEELEGYQKEYIETGKCILKPKNQMIDKYEQIIVNHSKPYTDRLKKQDREFYDKTPSEIGDTYKFINIPDKKIRKMPNHIFCNKIKQLLNYNFMDDQKILQNRKILENFISEKKREVLFPVNTFKRAYLLSERILSESEWIIEIFEERLIKSHTHFDYSKFEVENFDRTFWDSNKDKLTKDPNLFPYSRYVLKLWNAIDIYQTHNKSNPKVQRTDMEYLYYLYFPNVLFVTADNTLTEIILSSQILKNRENASFIHIPSPEKHPKEYKKALNFIEHGSIHNK